MPKMRRLRLLQKCNSARMQHLSGTSKPTLTSYGTEIARYVKKGADKLDTIAEQRQRKQYTHLNYAERKTIGKLLKENQSLSSIARTLGRGKQAVTNEVARNGGRQVYNPEEAERKAQQRKDIRDQKCSDMIKQRYKEAAHHSIEDRVQTLEMQLEILIETVKEVVHDRNQKYHTI